MILQALSQLYDRLKDDPENYQIPRHGHSFQQISFVVVLHPDGSLFEIQDARISNNKNKLRNIEIEVLGETKASGSGLNPCFLWDQSTYLLGKRVPQKPEKYANDRFQAFKDKHIALEAEIDDRDFSTVCHFLNQWTPSRCAEYPILDELKTGFGIFKIIGAKYYVHQTAKIENWWQEKLANTTMPSSKPSQAPCLVTGQQALYARLHPKIKGVWNAQSSGAPLISFNEKAYESFGKTNAQGANAPVSKTIARNYASALNALLKNPKHNFHIGDTTVVFWTETPTTFENSFSGIINDIQDKTQRQQIENLLKSISTGKQYNEFQEEQHTDFFMLGLAPNKSRISIRFFHRTSIADILSKLHAHQKALKIIKKFSEPTKKGKVDLDLPPIWMILRETARESKDIPPLLSGTLLRAIFQGTNYPEALFAIIIRRMHADRNINYIRAAMLKAILIRNHNYTITTMIDKENTEPAYLSGRLFATLEKTQEDAIKNLNSGLRDKYYSSASATPASVFPRILRLFPHHLSKIESKPIKIFLEKIVEEILSKVSASEGFPVQLNLQEQGLFAIGYYHQRRDFFTKKDPQEKPESQTVKADSKQA